MKKIKFPDKNAQHESVLQTLCEYYPPLLSQERAIMLWRCTLGGAFNRPLEKIPPGPDGYSVAFLKNAVQGTIYIIELPGSSSLSSSSQNKPVAKAKCKVCTEKVSLDIFADHLLECSKNMLKEDLNNLFYGCLPRKGVLFILRNIF